MMTIRVKTGQNDRDVCIQALLFAFNTGVSEMRTPWFSITVADGLRWKDIGFGTSVLDLVGHQQYSGRVKGGIFSDPIYPAGFESFIGIHTL